MSWSQEVHAAYLAVATSAPDRTWTSWNNSNASSTFTDEPSLEIEATSVQRILFVFIDGLGLGPDVAHNPLASLPLPNLAHVVGAPLVEPQFENAVQSSNGARLVARLDAVLGVDGVPQSGTGQTAIYSGRNAQRLAGRHVPALPGRRLRELLEAESIFRLREDDGRRPTVAFANAFTSTYLERLEAGGIRMSAAVAAARASGVRLRDEKDLEQGHAVSWDLTGAHFGIPLPALRLAPRSDRWRASSPPSVTPIDPATAATRLLDLAGLCRLTIFETYLADLAGHGRFVIDAVDALGRLDSFLGVLVARRPSDVTVVVTSDHGNVEDGSGSQHTRNKVPLLVFGPAASAFEGASRIIDVRWSIERALGLGSAQTHG